MMPTNREAMNWIKAQNMAAHRKIARDRQDAVKAYQKMQAIQDLADWKENLLAYIAKHAKQA